MKDVEKIVTKNNGERLQKCIAELESENFKLKGSTTEAYEDYEARQLGNASL
jgi:hypothetical protein